MKVTEAIAVEHATLLCLFDEMLRVLPRVKSVAAVGAMASVVEGLLGSHGALETDLAFVPLDHALHHKRQLKRLERDHRELDARLNRVGKAGTCAAACRLFRAALRASRRHFFDEERSIFPALERTLKPQSLAALGKGFRRSRQRLAQRHARAFSGSA